jgi:putative ABC transport system substrate-binding protein
VLWQAGSAEEEAVYLSALEQGLADRGYIDRQTIILEHRFPNEQPERFVSLGAELAALKVDVLVAVTRLAAVAMQQATSTIPIVFILVPDPVGAKLVSNLARPGGNVTGLTHVATELSAKRLALLKEAFPSLLRAALLVNPGDPEGMRRNVEETRTAAIALGVDVQAIEVKSLTLIENAFDRIVESKLEGVTVPADGLFFQGRELIARP